MHLAILIAICVFLFPMSTPAKGNDGRKPKQLIVGYITDSQKPIQAVTYSMPYPVSEIESDTSQNLILVLRNSRGSKGRILSLNPGKQTVNWEKKITDFGIKFTKDLMLYQMAESTKVLNKHTGAFMYGTTLKMKIVDKNANTALTDADEYMNIATKQILWQEKLNLKRQWSDRKWLNDTTLLIASEGLYMLGVRDGSHWHYKMETGKVNTELIVAAGLSFALFGAVTLPFVMASDFSTDLSSNIVVDTTSGRIFYSSYAWTVALDLDGREIWARPMNRGETSRSYIWKDGECLMHINLGYSDYTGSVIEGEPFIAAYNTATGAAFYKFRPNNKGVVSSFQSSGSRTLLKYGSSLLLYDHYTGQQIAEKELDRKTDRKNPLEVVDGGYYYLRTADSNFYALKEIEANRFFVSDSAAVNSLNEDLATVNTRKQADCWTLAVSDNDLLFLRKGDQIAVVRDDRAIAFLTMKGSLAIERNQLLVHSPEQVTVLPLSEFAE